MTAFSKDDIPDSVDTLEKAAVWIGTALHAINYDQTVIEGTGNPVRVAQQQLFFINNTNEHRLMLRQSIAVDGTYSYSGQKLWTHALELNQVDIPTQFLEP